MAIAKDVMTTQVMTILPTATIYEAMKMMVEIQISGLIVTDDQNNAIGVLTERDALVAYDFLSNMNAPVGDFMNKKVISVAEDTPLEEISDTLVKGDVRRVPVLRGRQVIGVVSRRDLLKYALKNHHY
jgi:CBS domain-containing protein